MLWLISIWSSESKLAISKFLNEEKLGELSLYGTNNKQGERKREKKRSNFMYCSSFTTGCASKCGNFTSDLIVYECIYVETISGERGDL